MQFDVVPPSLVTLKEQNALNRARKGSEDVKTSRKESAVGLAGTYVKSRRETWSGSSVPGV
jgi:hypothetical protein